MIVCTLNGKMAYPSSSGKIKVTYENQYIKDSGSYTYDITFPMDIAANRKIFGNVQRIDVKKTIADFETCRLYAGNRLVMSGKGTVTSITPEKVKVQIVGGKSRIKYNSKFEKQYIDWITVFDENLEEWGEQHLAHLKWAVGYRSWADNYDHGALLFDPSQNAFLGKEGKFSYNPIFNSGDNINCNTILLFKKDDGTYRHVIIDLAVQPWLMYTLEMVLKAAGYTLVRNDFDKDPWNRLVIASADKLRNGGTFGTRGDVAHYRKRNILPHMTVYDFLENIRKLLGGTFVFDELSKKVSFVKEAELSGKAMVHYDCEDEFSVEHEEEGLKSVETSNVKYNIEESSERDWKDVMTDDVLKNFDIKQYANLSEMNNDVEGMSNSKKYYTIFNVNNDWYIYKGTKGTGAHDDRFGGSRTGSMVAENGRIAVGYFNPVIRNKDSDEYEEINIIPAAISMQDKSAVEKSSSESYYNQHIRNIVKDAIQQWFVPSIEVQEKTFDEKSTVYEAMTEGGSGADQEESDTSDTTLSVFFQSRYLIDVTNNKIVSPGNLQAGVAYMPLVYTDYRQLDIFSKGNDFKEEMSLSFKSLGMTDKPTQIDSQDEIVIKFLTDEIPDPTNLYMFHNKKYICSKIEMNVTEDGIEKEKTGYFYEML